MVSKIRLLFDANPLVGQKTGVGYYTEGLIKALSEIPELELSGHYFKSRGRAPALPKANNLNFTSSPWLAGQFIKALRKVHIRLPWELISGRRGDVLLFPDFTTWPSLFRTPKILTVHDLTYIDYPQYVRKRNLKHLRRYVAGDASRANLVLTISRFTKSRLVQEFKLPAEKIIVEPVPPPKPLTPKSSIRLPKKFILFIGSVEPRKNVSGLLEAYALLSEELRAEYALVLAGGQGWDSKETIARAKQLQAEGHNIILSGYVDEPTRAALYAQAAVVAVPSFYEGFGMPILEAMSYGVPVIASNLPVFKEVAGSDGLYFDPDSAKAIKDALQKILTDNNLRSAQVGAGSAQLKNYSWDKVANEIYQEIRKLADV